MQLPAQLRLGDEGLVFGRTVDERQVGVFGSNKIGLGGVEGIGRLRLLHLGGVRPVVRVPPET